MSQGEGTFNIYENCGGTRKMELEKLERRRTPREARAVVLLYVLLALTFIIFTALTIVNLQRVSAAWEALEEARMRSENSHTTAWHNLSEVQGALDKRLSGELEAIHSRLLNVSGEVENAQWKVMRSRAEGGKELLDRLRALEERAALEPVLRQLVEVKQEQSRTSALLDTALEQMQKLSGILCLTCPTGWEQFAKTCYFFSAATKPWVAAKEFCATVGAHLAIVDTEQENKFLANHIMNDRVFWLGMTDAHQEGDWQWVNGRSLSLSFWNSGEPNNAGHHGEDCVTIYSNGRWNDDVCSNSHPWICERSC